KVLDHSGVADALRTHRRLGATDSLKKLGSGWRRAADDVERRAAPVTGHLASAGGRIVGRTSPLLQHVLGSDAERQAESAVAVMRIEPIVGGLQRQRRGDKYSFVAGAGNLKERFVLRLELYFFVVDAPRRVHQAINANH